MDATSFTPHQLIYSHDVVLFLKDNLGSLKVVKQKYLSIDKYQQVFLIKLDSIYED